MTLIKCRDGNSLTHEARITTNISNTNIIHKHALKHVSISTHIKHPF